MILQLIFIALAAICKAMVDTIAFHEGGKFKSDFFNINKQGKMLPFTKYPLDGFHLFNSLMILCFILAATSSPLSFWRGAGGEAFYIIILGILFILVFNTFFNHIFKQKKP